MAKKGRPSKRSKLMKSFHDFWFKRMESSMVDVSTEKFKHPELSRIAESYNALGIDPEDRVYVRSGERDHIYSIDIQDNEIEMTDFLPWRSHIIRFQPKYKPDSKELKTEEEFCQSLTQTIVDSVKGSRYFLTSKRKGKDFPIKVEFTDGRFFQIIYGEGVAISFTTKNNTNKEGFKEGFLDHMLTNIFIPINNFYTTHTESCIWNLKDVVGKKYEAIFYPDFSANRRKG